VNDGLGLVATGEGVQRRAEEGRGWTEWGTGPLSTRRPSAQRGVRKFGSTLELIP
jgi:hypothetical protein